MSLEIESGTYGGESTQADPSTAAQAHSSNGHTHSSPNVGRNERIASVSAGAFLAILGLSRGSLPGLLIAGVGGALIHRGVTAHCKAYDVLGINTAENENAEEEMNANGIHFEHTFTIGRSSEELYNYWRDLRNLPTIMSHLQRVDVRDEKNSHWVATAPKLAGGVVEWDAEITNDVPNELIAWKSLHGGRFDHVGEVRFTPAPGDRGTEVRLALSYSPPGGRVTDFVASLFGATPRQQMREDLRNFKTIMETGEIPTIEGQPRGTCRGKGTRETY